MAVDSRRNGAAKRQEARRILGIDPGTVVTGWGIVESAGSSLLHVAHGTIVTSGAQGQGARLDRIFRGIRQVLQRYQPDGASLEKVFFARNAQSALKLGQARGVAFLAAAECNIAVHEYTSSEIKLAVVGYGQATKEQVQAMVASLLHLPAKIAGDAADALAAAICHLHRQTFQARLREALPAAPELRRRKLS